ANISGGTNYVIKFTSATVGGNSQIFDNGTNVGIGTTSPGAKLEVAGQVKITGGTPAAGEVLTSDGVGLATWEAPSGGGPDDDADSTNELQSFLISGDTLFLRSSNYVIIPGLGAANTGSGDSIQDADGNWYQTAQFGTQWWMTEDLNVGTEIAPAGNQTNNATIEKYCHGGINGTSTQGDCSVWGGLYQWDEAMQYVTTVGAQGICPTGWHIPTDAEWMILEEYLGMCPGGTNACPGTACSGEECWRGTDQGDQLKTAADCAGGTNCGISGFEFLLAGSRVYVDGNFYELNMSGSIWTSNETAATTAYARHVFDNNSQVYRMPNNVKQNGYSVRCIKD
ncbi:MAG: fibrobacter succinogenes major paralogous domain-containing protein, partial [Flavobacteriales bacterium]|nr:fibrobacter succinogenes major paralogous domain-containing protein [Flavobacteriales bacterium]